MRGVHPDLITIFSEAIKNSPIDFGIPQYGGLRAAAEQNELFQKNLSECDGIINLSNHQSGNALDFYAYLNGKASWDKGHLSMVAAVIMATATRLKKEGKIQSEINWGGAFGSDNFQGWDMPHVEIA